MTRLKPILVLGVAVGMAVATTTGPAAASETDTTKAAASGATPHGHVEDIVIDQKSYGALTWYDYYDNGEDLDLILVSDRELDGKSVKTSIEWDGVEYTQHVYNGAQEVAFSGAEDGLNVPKGEKIHVKSCYWDDGDWKDCTSGYFVE